MKDNFEDGPLSKGFMKKVVEIGPEGVVVTLKSIEIVINSSEADAVAATV